MNVLMLSLDRALAGDRMTPSDAVKRHQEYALGVDFLMIVVLTRQGYVEGKLADNCVVVPTNSRSRIAMIRDALKVVRKLMNERPVDLLVAQAEAMPIARMIGKKENIPIIASFHAASFDTPDWKRHFESAAWATLVRKSLASAEKIRVVSHTMAERLKLHGIPPARIAVVPTAVDIKRFIKPNQLRLKKLKDAFGVDEIIVYVGRLEPVKNIQLLIEAMAEVALRRPSARLVIVGEGTERERIAEQVRKRGLSSCIVFAGPVDAEHIVEYYHAARVGVLPSRSESLGKVLIEAGAASLPVVATDTDGARSVIVAGKTGYLVPQGDARGMAEKIVFLLEHSPEATEMGKRAQEHIAKHFNWEQSIEQVLSLWKSAVAKGAHS